jgi:hypothetical protein
MPNQFDITVADDSGILGLVDPQAYRCFVDPDWTHDTLFLHFNGEMGRQRILVWDCGDGGGQYRIRVRRGFTAERGWREVTGSIIASSGALLISSYSALTMAAQFDDAVLPPPHEAHQALEIFPGTFKVRVVQTYDPDDAGVPDEVRPHFIVELEAGHCDSWKSVAWHTT